MAIHVLANDGISADGKAAMEAAGFEVSTENVPQEQLIEAINERDIKILLVRSATKVRKDIIDACKGLEMIGRGGVGMDNIDVAYAREQGKTVFNTPASSSQAVAELVMAHLFSTARGLYDANRNMPTKGGAEFKVLKKKYGKGVELRGKTLGIIGFGRIGQFVASYALGCGMNVVAFNRTALETTIQVPVGNHVVDVPVKTVSKEQVLQSADFITLHIPAQESGPAIGAKEFEAMKDGAILINTARGGVVDEGAMLDALKRGKLAHAGVDVFENEPTPRADVLASSTASLSPHIGAATVEAQARIGMEIASIVKEHYNA